MEGKKRKPRAYKISDEMYLQAMENTSEPLATFIEKVVVAVAIGSKIHIDGKRINEKSATK